MSPLPARTSRRPDVARRMLPARLTSSVVWELRAAWGSGRRVALTLDRRADVERLEGHISAVAATGAYCHLAGRHVPVDVVLAVHLPSRLGDSTIRPGAAFHGRARRPQPQDEDLFADVSAHETAHGGPHAA